MSFKLYFENFIKRMDSDIWQQELAKNHELSTAVEMMKKIKKLFPNKEIYIVGGVPRDLVMGNEVDDVDLATNISFDELGKHFELRDISKNGSQPVYKINYEGYSFDLAQFRKDSKTVGRQNNVSELTDDFKADTDRRDLTINSFGLDENGNIIDYQGGLEDLKNQLIKTVGDAKERFMEDATRILRVARFAAKMGFKIDPDTRQSMIELKDVLQDRGMISNESISKEFYKAAKSGKTLRKFLEHLIDTGILPDVLPEFMAMDGMMHDIKHHPEGEGRVLGHIMECLSASKFNDPIINLAVLFHDFGKASTYKLMDGRHTYHGHEGAGVPIVENIFKRLGFSELTAQDKKSILVAVSKHMLIHNLDNLSIKVLTSLVNDPSWEVLKATAYCDEASRGAPLFNAAEFEAKIQRAEEKVKVLGDAQAIKNKIKEHINGQILMNWFPMLKEKQSLIGKVLPSLQDFVLDKMNKGEEISPQELQSRARNILGV